jgi:hypothetical protein
MLVAHSLPRNRRLPGGSKMRNGQRLLITVVVLMVGFAAASAQTPTSSSQTSNPIQIRVLKNNDIVRMVEKGERSGDIIARIVTSQCNFDIFPPVLKDLRRRGVPETVLMAMKMVPVGPPSLRSTDEAISRLTPVEISAGTTVEVEAAFPVSSAKAKKGDLLSFQTTRQVFANGVLVIDRGSLAKARVVNVTPAARLGRPGMLAWSMEYVEAVDGTRLPLQISGLIKGNNRALMIAGAAAATGALAFPYTSPIALVWGLKKGDEAILRGSKAFSAVTTKSMTIAGIATPRRLIFHNMDAVKASLAPVPNTPLERLEVRH